MFKVKIQTALALGLQNLGRVFIYQFGVKTGLNPVKKISSAIVPGDIFLPYEGNPKKYKINTQWLGAHSFFGYQNIHSDGVPDWHRSCLTNQTVKQSARPWYQIPDFDEQLGDIKGVWEASRFDWVLGFSQSIAAGNGENLDKLNVWLQDWLEHNPPYIGVNWKCGQEASIRVMHLAVAAKILTQQLNTSVALLSLIKAHLKRIAPTIMYAIAQDNNHGTSEAAALYIGGSWLVANGDSDGESWQKQGLKWLENRAKRLIESDGSFSQYSVTYHRVVLDTYCMAEVWRKELALPEFSKSLYAKLQAATLWLHNMVQPQNGDAPNLGANDGARLLPLSATDYRDFRPSVQLAACLFLNEVAYVEDGDWDLPLKWLGLNKPTNLITKRVSVDFELGGYALLRNKNAFAMFNYPRFRFRPSQCDVLHLDFWHQGENILRDGGTYSYNAGSQFIDYYGGSISHNTVQFDDHEQMPRLSRFLLGCWLKTMDKSKLRVQKNRSLFSASYRDRFGCSHKRAVSLSETSLKIMDTLTCFEEKAVLRWRLQPGDWKFTEQGLTSSDYLLIINADVAIKRIELVTGFESRYYYQQTELPVLEVEVQYPGTITTEIFF